LRRFLPHSCPITWNKGKNVTVKVVKKKQKHKGRGVTRTVTKMVKNDSFFNFFDPPQVPEGENEDDVVCVR
jgi:nucleosome assembly protein 1-like 1